MLEEWSEVWSGMGSNGFGDGDCSALDEEGLNAVVSPVEASNPE